MKALKEIGIKKALKYLLGEIELKIFHLLITSSLRIFYLRLLGSKIGKNCVIHDINFMNVYRTGFKGLNIGNNVFIGEECLLDLADNIYIEDNVTISERVLILTHQNVGYEDHPLQKYFKPYSKSVKIKDGSFIGSNVTIFGGVTIERCSAIGACSLVNKDTDYKCLYYGIPIKLIKFIKK